MLARVVDEAVEELGGRDQDGEAGAEGGGRSGGKGEVRGVVDVQAQEELDADRVDDRGLDEEKTCHLTKVSQWVLGLGRLEVRGEDGDGDGDVVGIRG